MVDHLNDFRALDPFFRIIEQGLAAYADGEHFFDLLADDVVFDFIITVPDYPRRVVGRDNLIELYRGYGYPVGVNEKTSTTNAAINSSHATTGTSSPPRRRAVKNDSTTATTATMGAPYWMSVKPSSLGPWRGHG